MSHALPLLGRRKELHALAALFRQGDRALVLGPRGMGKTRLVAEAAQAAGVEPLVLSSPGPLRELAWQLLQQMSGARPPAPSPRRLTSQLLQSRVLRALEARPRWIWIDNPTPAGARVARFFERVLWIDGCGLVVSAEDRTHLGRLASLLWDPRTHIMLRPLARADSEALLDEAIRAFSLEALGSLAVFRAQALEAAAGSPGRIVTLCRLAAQPQYWHQGHLLFAPLWIDTLTHLA
ncbi:MAG: AAA family ATPase [Bryobacteraceae bacterium]